MRLLSGLLVVFLLLALVVRVPDALATRLVMRALAIWLVLLVVRVAVRHS